MAAVSAPGEFEIVLRRLAMGARLLGLVWWAALSVLVVVENRSGGLERPLIPVAAVVTAGVWAAVTSAAFARSPMTMTSAPVVAGDAVLALTAVLGPTFAYGGQPEVLFYGGFPFIVVLICSIRSTRAGWAAAILLGAATLVGESTATNGEPSFAFPVSQVLVYLAGAFIFTWAMRVLRRSDAEIRAAQAALARAEERAEISGHLHDSVLQSLALIQRAADRPEEVVSFARRQERELRAYLHGNPGGADEGLTAAIRRIAADVEEHYRVPIEVVAVGDAPWGPRVEAVVAAGREAMVNAAKHAASATVSVFVEGAEGSARVYVRDRGVGFDPDTVDGDRMGIRGSIRARLQRAGGSAELRTGNGTGTEWKLEVPL